MTSFLNLLPTLTGNIQVLPLTPNNLGKTPDHTKAETLFELKRFLYLLAQTGEALVPSQYVAMALAETIGFRGKSVLEPIGLGAIHLSSPQAQLRLAAAYAHTISLRDREFGEADPKHVWPKALAMKLQLVGWIALTQGIATAILGHLGVVPILWAVPGLILGGFLYFTEGPWPLSLPFRRSFMARLLV